MGLGYYPELSLPCFLVHIFLFLSYMHYAVSWALDAVGLDVLVDGDTDFFAFTSPPSSSEPAHNNQSSLLLHRPAQPIYATLIRRVLPTSRYEPPSKHVCEDSDPDSCSVCLYGLEVGDEVRHLVGCRHVFHACCIDKWVDVGQRTCPLCRAQLMPQDLLREAMIATGKLSGDAAATDSLDLHLPPPESYYYDDGLYFGNDGDYYPVLQDEFHGFLDTDLLSSTAHPDASSTNIPSSAAAILPS